MNCGVITIRHTVRSFRRELAANKLEIGLEAKLLTVKEKRDDNEF